MSENNNIDLQNQTPDGATPDGGARAERPVHDGGRDFLDGFLNVSDSKKTNADSESSESGDDRSHSSDAPAPDGQDEELHNRVIDALCSIYDPEIPVNIYELGLIYSVAIDSNKMAKVIMTLTTPHCPVAETLPGEVQERVEMVEGIQGAKVELVWEPPWDPSRMSEAAQLELGFI